MDFLNVLILSIVEGLSEFLPISSTGHLILTSNLLNIPQSEFLKSFEIFIQLGAILAVAVLFLKKFLEIKMLGKVFVAFLPTALVGLIFYKLIKNYLLSNPSVVLIALFLGGVVLILFEKFYFRKNAIEDIEKINTRQALAIGLIQSISVIPGVSRAAATIVGGMGVGLSRTVAVEFSFLLAVPTMVAASGYDLIKTGLNFSSEEVSLLLFGFAGSFVTALIAVKFLLKYVRNHNFVMFGVYRIILSLVYWFLIIK